MDEGGYKLVVFTGKRTAHILHMYPISNDLHVPGNGHGTCRSSLCGDKGTCSEYPSLEAGMRVCSPCLAVVPDIYKHVLEAQSRAIQEATTRRSEMEILAQIWRKCLTPEESRRQRALEDKLLHRVVRIHTQYRERPVEAYVLGVLIRKGDPGFCEVVVDVVINLGVAPDSECVRSSCCREEISEIGPRVKAPGWVNPLLVSQPVRVD